MSITHTSQVRMNSVRLRCPVAVADLRNLQLGDLVFLDGPLFTGREGVYQRFLGEGIDPPVHWQEMSNVNFHCSPAASPLPGGGYQVKAVTATASFRFGKWMPQWFARTGVKLIIGKGGMRSADYKATFLPQDALYLTTVGYGLGATYGRAIKKVIAAHWLEELGIAQAIWVLDCDGMGPFIVESDMAGNSLFELSNQEVNQKLEALYEGLPEPALRRFGETTNRQDEVL